MKRKRTEPTRFSLGAVVESMCKSQKQVMDEYLERLVANTTREENHGIRVSTAWTNDEGYETALCDEQGVHPVERYKTLKEARAGHKKWIKKSRTVKKVVSLGSSDGIFPPDEVELDRGDYE